MTPQQLKTKWIESRPVTIAVITFLLGFGLNGLTGLLSLNNQFIVLTQKVAELSIKVDKASDKIDLSNDRYNNHETRISVIESRLSIGPKPISVKLATN